MRAVVFAISMFSRRKRRRNHRLSIVLVQGAVPPMPGGSPARNFGWRGILVDRRRVLCGNATDCQPKNQNYDRGFPKVPHGPILMPILSVVLVTLVQGLISQSASDNLEIPAPRSIDENPGQPSWTFWQRRSLLPAACRIDRPSTRTLVPAQESCRFV